MLKLRCFPKIFITWSDYSTRGFFAELLFSENLFLDNCFTVNCYFFRSGFTKKKTLAQMFSSSFFKIFSFIISRAQFIVHFPPDFDIFKDFTKVSKFGMVV